MPCPAYYKLYDQSFYKPLESYVILMIPYIDKGEDGRYITIHNVEAHVAALDPSITDRAKRARADMVAVAAIDLLVDQSEIGDFKDKVYPLEIAREKLKSTPYSVLENNFLTHPFIAVNPLTGKQDVVNPKSLAELRLRYAMREVYAKAYGDDAVKMQAMAELWKLRC